MKRIVLIFTTLLASCESASEVDVYEHLTSGSFLQTAHLAECTENAGHYPLLPIRHERCPGERLRVAMDDQGRERFTVEVEYKSCGKWCKDPEAVTQSYLLVDNSTGHRYPFAFSREVWEYRGYGDKLLFLYGSQNTSQPVPGDYVYVMND